VNGQDPGTPFRSANASINTRIRLRANVEMAPKRSVDKVVEKPHGYEFLGP
jgi:hypothetical protein